jgi:hypothetical protein
MLLCFLLFLTLGAGVRGISRKGAEAQRKTFVYLQQRKPSMARRAAAN